MNTKARVIEVDEGDANAGVRVAPRVLVTERTEAIVPITACSAPPIGVGGRTGTRQTAVSTPGATLACFFTDGVVEARVAGELFGAHRLERVLGGLAGEATATEVLDLVAQECDRHPDDMAACLLRVEGDPGAPSVGLEELELDARDLAGSRVERFLLAGGVDPAAIGAILQSARETLARHGRVVLELRLGEDEPVVSLRPQNVTTLQTTPPIAASARGGSR